MLITERDKRRCEFYIRYLRDTRRVDISFNQSWSAEQCCKVIDDVICNLELRESSEDRLIDRMQRACDEAILPISDFSWLMDDERRAFFAWCLIYECGSSLPRRRSTFVDDCTTDEEILLAVERRVKLKRASRDYVDFVGEVIPDNLKSYHNSIVRFFDALDFRYDDKVILLNDLKEKVTKGVSSFNPLEEIGKKNEAYTVNGYWDYLSRKRLVLPYLNPVTEKDKEMAMYAFFDMLDVNISAKKMILSKLKNALTQLKSRSKKSGLVQLTADISPESKSRLKKLARESAVNMGVILEKLINDEYNKRRSK